MERLKGRSWPVGLLLAAFLIAVRAGPPLLKTANARPSADEVTELRKALVDLRALQTEVLEAYLALNKLFFVDFEKGVVSDTEARSTAQRWHKKLESLGKKLEDRYHDLGLKEMTESRWRRAWRHGFKAADNLWEGCSSLKVAAAAIQDMTKAVRGTPSWHISWYVASDRLDFAKLHLELAYLHLELMERELER